MLLLRNKVKIKVLEIANLRTGLFAKPLSMGDVVYLQSKHFDEQGNLITIPHADLNYSDISEKHLLVPGDVVFASKGSKNFAAVFEGGNFAAVASTSFFVIRITDSRIIPEYLAWFLNYTNTQEFIKSQAKGTSMPSISIKVIENVEIPLLTFEEQRMMIQIAKLRVREKDIINQLQIQKDKKIQIQISKLLK